MRAQQMGLFLLIISVTIAAESQSPNELQQVYTITNETHSCYNASLERFRLNATILEVRNVSSKQECVDKCLAEPCCRSINYEYSTSPYIPNKCEFLHDLLDQNTSSGLVENTLFDHAYIIQPYKAYNDNCFHKFPETYFLSCEDVFEKHSSAPDRYYQLQSNKTNGSYLAYCTNGGCGGGVWTLVMTLNGDKDTFQYNSSYWTNNETLIPKNTTSDAKLASYNYTPFNKICLVMEKDGVNHSEKNFTVLNYTASSLYSVIAGGSHNATDAGRAKWMSLVNDYVDNTSGFCSKEGFNINATGSSQQLNMRFGWVGYNAAVCGTLVSFIGFGVETQGKNNSYRGNIGLFPGKGTNAIGFIFVQ